MPGDEDRERADATKRRKLSAPARGVISLLLILHLTIVVAAPMSMVPPRSSLANRIRSLVAPYLEGGNVSHGYAFFAPNPGPSHIVRYELVFQDGHTEQGIFPDLKKHWPRLRYHRHFMLTEQLSGMEPGPDPSGPAEEGVEVLESVDPEWEQRRDRFLRQARSYARHLLNTHSAKEVRLRLIEHQIPSRQEFIDGARLGDEDSYRPYPVDPLIVVRAEDD